MKYLPFISDTYSVGPGLIPFSRTDQSLNNLYFHIDEGYKKYIQNKEQRRNENLTKYHPGFPVSKEVIKPIVQFILTQLLRENPLSFETFEGDHHTVYTT